MIISISGKLNSGKDTVGEIVQIISASPHFTDEAVLSFIGRQHLNSIWEIKKFADKLKDIVCMLLGCTREQLEDDREFKEKELGEEWWYYKDSLFTDDMYSYLENKERLDNDLTYYIIKHTPRSLLQLLGTECGREIIHPNIWVNSLMADYKNNLEFPLYNEGKVVKEKLHGYPNWIITDTRFPNELAIIEKRSGVTIRVNRPKQEWIKVGDWEAFTGKKVIHVEEHPSETALDNAEFDYVIENDGELVDLVSKVREIMLKENLWQEKQ